MDNSVIVALITLFGVIISALITRNNLLNQLDKKDALLEQRLNQIDEHLKSHNGYSKLFAETMPVIREEIKHINYRLEMVENWEKNHGNKC